MTATGGYFKIYKRKKVVFNSTFILPCIFFIIWIGTCGVWQTVIHSILLGWIHFYISFISVLFWNYRLSYVSFVPPPIQEETWLQAVVRLCGGFHAAFMHHLRLGTFHSSYLTVFDPAALSNECESNGLPLPFLLFPFSSSSLRRTVAGRMLRPPHQWLHPQKDPEAFTLTPPTDPPPLLPPHSSVLHCSSSTTSPPPPSHISQNLKTHRDWMWRTVCGHAAGTHLGSGTTFSLLRTNVSLFPIRTVAALLSGWTHITHFTVCTVSTRCPCCLFVFLLHYIFTQPAHS